jgi:K(+)-stimulated pyrophosphate-energized sodium pump
VALNPIIKFTTLFGLLAVELAEQMQGGVQLGAVTVSTRVLLAAVFFVFSLVFIWRSFYAMRIESGGSAVARVEPVGAE